MSGALFARNPYSTEFAGRVAFVDAQRGRANRDRRPHRVPRPQRHAGEPRGDAPRRGSPAESARARPVRGHAGPVRLDGRPGEARSSSSSASAATPSDGAATGSALPRGCERPRSALEGVWQYWSHTLGAVNVETPDPAVNFLANGWLIYQTLACRMWARTGSTSRAAPSASATSCRTRWRSSMPSRGLLREHLLLCAARQFREGDVQHWWHPPDGPRRAHALLGRLPLAAATRLAATSLRTGDTGVLDEARALPRGPPGAPGGRSYYDLPQLRRRRPRSTSIASARSTTACSSAPTACR